MLFRSRGRRRTSSTAGACRRSQPRGRSADCGAVGPRLGAKIRKLPVPPLRRLAVPVADHRRVASVPGAHDKYPIIIEEFLGNEANLSRGLREAQVHLPRGGPDAAVAEDHGSRRRPGLSTSHHRQRTPERGPHRAGLLLVLFCTGCRLPSRGGRFAIIDGQHRTTSAAIVGFESVPCQIVIAAKEEQAAAFKAINGTTTPISIMALHAAALVAGEP